MADSNTMYLDRVEKSKNNRTVIIVSTVETLESEHNHPGN